MKLTDRIILFIMIVIFSYAGLDKLFHYQGFIDALGDYVIIPAGIGAYLAAPIIGVEILLGMGLMVPAWRKPAALSGAGLLALFTVALAINYQLGGRGICGCWFTLTLSSSTETHVIQNLIFIAMCVSIWWTARKAPMESAPVTLEQSSG